VLPGVTNLLALVCHQRPDRSWLLAGDALALCQRCTGVHLGALLAVLMLFIARCPVSRRWIAVHFVLALQAAAFGLHLLPETPSIRTLSGQLFSIGIVYLLTAGLRAGMQWGTRSSLRGYLLGSLLSIALVQTAARTDIVETGAVLNTAALLGLLALIGLCVLNLIAVFRHCLCTRN
jgi:uncharacterized membrane protein